MKRALAIVCTLMLLLSLAACGKSGGDVVGTYKFVSVESQGTTMTRDQFVAMGASEKDVDSMFALEMKADGSFSIAANGDSQEGTYKDNKMTIDGEEVTFDYSGGKLTLDLPSPDGSASAKMTFEKQ